MTAILKPTRISTIVTYVAFGCLGGSIFGTLGALPGAQRARRIWREDPERYKRVPTSYRKLKADVLRKEIELLEGGDESVLGMVLTPRVSQN